MCPFNSTGEGWEDGRFIRAASCCTADVCWFLLSDFFMRNVWENVSVSVVQAEMIDGRPLLRWSLSAPCRLDGEVWPCCPLRGCAELQGLRQHLGNGPWKQDLRGHWVTRH